MRPALRILIEQTSRNERPGNHCPVSRMVSPKERELEVVKAAVTEAFAGVTSEGRASPGEAYRADSFKFDWDDHDTPW